MPKLPAITFPKTGDVTWTNRETGIFIERDAEHGTYRAYRVTRTGTYVGICQTVKTVALARDVAAAYVRDVARNEIAEAYVEAVREHVQRAEDAAEAAGSAAAWRGEAVRRYMDSTFNGPASLRAGIRDAMHMNEDAERCARQHLCTAKVNSFYPHKFESASEVTDDLTIKPGWDTCGMTEADHANYTPERILAANFSTARWRRAVENTKGHLGTGAMAEAYRELIDEALAEALAENARRTAELIEARDADREDVPVCLRTDSVHFFHMKAFMPECREETEADEIVHYWPAADGRSADKRFGDLSACNLDITKTPYTYGSPKWSEVTCRECLDGCTFEGEGWDEPHPYQYDPEVIRRRHVTDDGPTRCGAHQKDERHDLTEAAPAPNDRRVTWLEFEPKTTSEMPGLTAEMIAEQAAMYAYASEVIANATAVADDQPSTLPPVPNDVDDDAAWAIYCAALPAPTNDDTVATMLAFSHPYREEIEVSREIFRDAARSIWRDRREGRLTADAYRRLRTTMTISRIAIDACNDRARARAHRELAARNS